MTSPPTSSTVPPYPFVAATLAADACPGITATQSDPTVVAVLRGEHVALSTLDTRWTGSTAFESVSVLLATDDMTVAAGDVAAGAASLHGLSADLPSIDVVAGATVAGVYEASSEPLIDQVFTDDDATAAGAVAAGPLTDDVAALTSPGTPRAPGAVDCLTLDV